MNNTINASNRLVDKRGNPLITTSERDAYNEVQAIRLEAKREVAKIRARFDAAQTSIGNEKHWQWADNLDPHAVASEKVRRTLRSRSRYELLENNPFLKGIGLTMCNDFIGSGPKLKLTDPRIPTAARREVEKRWLQWCKVAKMRQKFWRMRMAKLSDGESLLRAYNNTNRDFNYAVQLDFQVLETDRIAGSFTPEQTNKTVNEIDGVRFDAFDNITEYHVLHSHPGNSVLFNNFTAATKDNGQWVPKKYMAHWFRQDRGWLRGIPEITPSLALCAILRRYTLAIVRWAEVAADFTAIIETEGPATGNPYGERPVDDPFDTFPIEQGMITTMPWGYQMKQLQAVPLGVQYDEFVGSLLREITRPILVPFNIAVGSSKDSNMASAVVDADAYKSGQKQERRHCGEDVVDQVFRLFWAEAIRVPGYLSQDMLAISPDYLDNTPDHRWRWDRIGLDHTDPAKVAKALETLHTKRFMTDGDIQEEYFDRDVEDWQDEIGDDDKFRKTLFDPDAAETNMEDDDDEDDEDDRKKKTDD